jgi:FlaA1/EpsC-like NDP-sugar epimerase
LVLISTDKAVNPTSIMGVTKRVAELLVQDAAQRTGRNFVVVRFGNVLGSRGSVVPILKRQIDLGGPLTVSHPDVRRFFMTIPEAVQLVLQAGVMGTGGEVFVLDMGEQIRITDLARDMIRLSGLEEGKDIDIVYTGLLPGEKMEEELFRVDEVVEKTGHDKILVSRVNGQAPGSDGPPERGSFQSMVDILLDVARQSPGAHLEKLLHDIVPEFSSPQVGHRGPAQNIASQGDRRIPQESER